MYVVAVCYVVRSRRQVREKALAIQRTLGDNQRVFSNMASNTQLLARVVWILGERKEGLQYCEEALQIQRRQGDKRGMALTLHIVGLIAAFEHRL
jgi:hypothetical protein